MEPLSPNAIALIAGGMRYYRTVGSRPAIRRPMPLTPEQQAEIAAARAAEPPDPPRDRAGAGGNPLRGAAGARPRLCPGHRLHGRRRRDRAGGARLVRARHQAGQRGPGPHQLSDAAPPHDAVRDVRDQVPRQIADLCRAAMDPPPHRQRQRILGALFDPRQRILHPGPRAPGRPIRRQPPGPRPSHRGRRRPPRPRPAARRCRARLCRLRRPAQRGRHRRRRATPPGPVWRASWPA